MKRVLPIVIFVCVLATVLLCLPKYTKEDRFIPTSIDDLNSMTIGIQSGCNYDIYVHEKYPDCEIKVFSDFSGMVESARQGKIDGYIAENFIIKYEMAENQGLTYFDDIIDTLSVCVGVTKKSLGTTVYNQFSEFLEKNRGNGTLDEVYDYWANSDDYYSLEIDKSGITGENGVLNCCVEAACEPFAMVGEGGELIGVHIDLIYRFCTEYGYTPQIDSLEYDAMTSGLASGKYVLAAGLIPDEERAEEVYFTESVVDYGIILAYFGEDTGNVNFFEDLINSFEKTFIRESRWKMFLKGAGTTLFISIASVIFGTFFGLLVYLWCYHGKRFENKVTSFFCWLIGCTPTVLFLLILYYVILGNYKLSNLVVSIIGFSILFAFRFYDQIVSGVNAVGIGQIEAARAQGFTANQTFFKIVLPQAMGYFATGYKNDVVSLIQETSIVGYIAVEDLTKMSDLIRGRTYDAFFPLIVTALIYFLLIFIVTSLINLIKFKGPKKN